jgi:uncharacterized protein
MAIHNSPNSTKSLRGRRAHLAGHCWFLSHSLALPSTQSESAEYVPMKITFEIARILKFYVYVYIDPRDGEPFYVGRGKGNRLFTHLSEQSEAAKVARINKIRASNAEPQIDILRYGLSESEAKLVEAAAIDLLGKKRLTNQMAGHHESSFGRITSQRAISMLTAKKVDVKHKAILITINKLYRSDMSPEELYETTRGIWRVNEKNMNKVEYALALYQGVVLEVYRIEHWYPAGTLTYHTRDTSHFKNSGRWEFSGTIAKDVRAKYVDYFVGKAGQNPIRYVNI